MVKSLRYFIFLLAGMSTLFGQEQELLFEKIQLSEGLSSNKVFMTLEDEEGYIWIATDRGIDRFDGRNIKNYSLDKIDEIRRLNFVELFLAKDTDGKIWMLSNNGLLQYCLKNYSTTLLDHP